MAYDTRLARLLHVLIHMHLRGGTTTSETSPGCCTPTLSSYAGSWLPCAMRVSSRRRGGRNGGWSLTRDLSATTAKDVYDAIPHGAVFAIAPADDNPRCPVEGAVNRLIVQAMHESEQVLLARLAGHTLSELAQVVTEPAGRFHLGAARQ